MTFERRKRLERECPVCEGRYGDVLHRQFFVLPEGHPLAAGYDVAVCDSCGFVFADTPESQDAYDALYSAHSIYSSRPGADDEVLPGWEMERHRVTASFLAGFVSPSQHVADVGSGSGALLVALREAGFANLTGIDPANECVGVLERRGFRALCGSLFRLPEMVDGARPDAVILSHVLEHIRDLGPALRSLERWAGKAGSLYVEVPDAERYVEFLFSPFQDFNTEHINHFSLTSLENLLNRAGFRLEASGRKQILSAPGKPYPALYCIARAGAVQPMKRVKDMALRPAVEAYICESRRFMEEMAATLSRELSKDPEVIVWGTGQLLYKLLAETALGNARIRFFVDGNPALQGKLLRGIPVEGPEAILSSSLPVVIATTLHAGEIESRIRSLGVKNRVIRLDRAEGARKDQA